VGFEKALIKVEKEQEFQELRETMERVLAPGSAERFLKRLASDGLRIRDFEKVLDRKAIDRVDTVLKQSGKTAKQLYQGLTLSDQAQMREFYLLKLETVHVALRHKFKKLFQYY
jgi:hypothetical protein